MKFLKNLGVGYELELLKEVIPSGHVVSKVGHQSSNIIVDSNHTTIID
jgi:hypothetical protein